MAGQLIQVATNTVTSAVASVTLTGIDSDDVYMVAFTNVLGTSEPTNFSYRMTESGTENSTSNYDYAFKDMFAGSGFSNRTGTNVNRVLMNQGSGSTALETQQGILYIYNANNSSEFTFTTFETTFRNAYGGALQGAQGGGVFTVTSSVDGIYFQQDSGNIASGTFSLFKVV